MGSTHHALAVQLQQSVACRARRTPSRAWHVDSAEDRAQEEEKN